MRVISGAGSIRDKTSRASFIIVSSSLAGTASAALSTAAGVVSVVMGVVSINLRSFLRCISMQSIYMSCRVSLLVRYFRLSPMVRDVMRVWPSSGLVRIRERMNACTVLGKVWIAWFWEELVTWVVKYPLSQS